MAKQVVYETPFFFLLSGENPELAVYEFESILSTLDLPIQLKISPDNRVIEFRCISNLQKNILQKSSFPSIISNIMKKVTLTHFCCQLLLQIDYPCHPPRSFSELVSTFNSSAIQELTPNQTFSVVTRRIGDPEGIFQQKNLSQELSRYIGTQILKKNPTKRVNLEYPDEKFIMILSKHGFWFGQFVSHSLRKSVQQRTAIRRPFFHPSSMNPLLQRTMVNLAAIRPGEWLLDPFCGTGGALIEAARMGIQSIGVEIDRKIIWGAYQNLKADEITSDSTHLIFGDANQLSIRRGSISAVVTDPPYGTASSTRGFDLQALLINFFRKIRPILSSQARVVIAMPSNIKIEDQVAQILNASYRKFLQYVHRSLTRKIVVFIVHQ